MAPPRAQLQVPGAPSGPSTTGCSHLGRYLGSQPPHPWGAQRLFLPSGEPALWPHHLPLLLSSSASLFILTCSLTGPACSPTLLRPPPSLSVRSSDPLFSCSQPETVLANLLVHPLLPPRDLSPTAPCPAAATASVLASISRISQDPRSGVGP